MYSLIDAAIAEGILTPEAAIKVRNVWREKALSPEESAVEILKMRKQHKPAGMLSSEQVAARESAKILMEALKQVKEMTKNQV